MASIETRRSHDVVLTPALPPHQLTPILALSHSAWLRWQPEWVEHLRILRVLDSDTVFLHGQERELRLLAGTSSIFGVRTDPRALFVGCVLRGPGGTVAMGKKPATTTRPLVKS